MDTSTKIILFLFLYVILHILVYGAIIGAGVFIIYELVTHIGHLGDLHGIFANR